MKERYWHTKKGAVHDLDAMSIQDVIVALIKETGGYVETRTHPCDIHVYGDITECKYCDKTWDTNDPNPPDCTLILTTRS